MSYLSYYDSTYSSPGKSIGDPSKCAKGEALINNSYKIIDIPSFYFDIKVVELANCAFFGTSIEKVFIPKTILYIGNGVFEQCKSLNEVRFESGSKLEKMFYDVFEQATSITRIDMPATVEELVNMNNAYLFVSVTSLSCFSYLGSTDFSETYVFYNNPEVHVSDSLYPKGKQFGRRDVIRDGKTCGVSKEPFTEKLKNRCTIVIRKRSTGLYNTLIFLLLS